MGNTMRPRTSFAALSDYTSIGYFFAIWQFSDYDTIVLERRSILYLFKESRRVLLSWAITTIYYSSVTFSSSWFLFYRSRVYSTRRYSMACTCSSDNFKLSSFMGETWLYMKLQYCCGNHCTSVTSTSKTKFWPWLVQTRNWNAVIKRLLTTIVFLFLFRCKIHLVAQVVNTSYITFIAY